MIIFVKFYPEKFLIYFQIRNTQKVERRRSRITHDAYYNTLDISLQNPDFVRLFVLVPRLLVYILHKNLKEQLSDAVTYAKNSTVQLLYDTTFNLGDFYVSPLIFRHTMFVGEKIVPVAFLIHDRKFQDDHEKFFRFVSEECPFLKKGKIVFITDREFRLNNIFPEAKQLYCWNHLIKNVDRWLVQHGVDAKKRNAYISDMYRLLKQDSLENFMALKNEKIMEWSDEFAKYFESRLEDDFKNHASRWILEPLGLYSPTSGITSNAAESFNNILKSWQNWREMPLDCNVLSLLFLCNFYDREIQRGLHGQGEFHLKDGIKPRDVHYLPNQQVLSATKILDFVQKEAMDKNMYPHEIETSIPTDPYLALKAQARNIVLSNQIHLDVPMQVFLVKSAKENDPPFCIKLNPEKCTCKSPNTCAHILAARMASGLETVINKKNPNMALIRRNSMKVVSKKKSGRKAPRRGDTTKTTHIDLSVSLSKKNFYNSEEDSDIKRDMDLGSWEGEDYPRMQSTPSQKDVISSSESAEGEFCTCKPNVSDPDWIECMKNSSVCKLWYHKNCQEVSSRYFPNESLYWECEPCFVSDVIKWSPTLENNGIQYKLKNTCPIDNALMIFYVHAKYHKNFLKQVCYKISYCLVRKMA